MSRKDIRLKTWVITYVDGKMQEVDAFTKGGAEMQATHGASIKSVVEGRIPRECSICRGRHGVEVQHPCE